MSNIGYLDTYLARINKLGATHKERELNASIADFERYLLEHPSSETIVVNGVDELVSIISNKENENKMVKQILSRLTTTLIPGSLFIWDGSTWIVYFQETNPNEAYISSLAVRCNEIMKWINNYGVIKISPCYVVGSMASIIKSNFRTSNGVVVSSPNQFLEILMPYNADLIIGKKFIFSQRAWIIVDYDTISVPGIMYLSLTEDKIDRMDDNQTVGIAEYNNYNSYTIELAINELEVVLGTPYSIFPVVKHNGEIITTETLTYEIVNELLASATIITGGVRISGILAGTTSLVISLENAIDVHLDIPIIITNSGINAPGAIISGPDILRLGMFGTYRMYEFNETEILLTINSFTIDKPTYATGVLANGILTLTANENGLVGDIIITLVHGGITPFTVTKTITIRSLW